MIRVVRDPAFGAVGLVHIAEDQAVIGEMKGGRRSSSHHHEPEGRSPARGQPTLRSWLALPVSRARLWRQPCWPGEEPASPAECRSGLAGATHATITKSWKLM